MSSDTSLFSNNKTDISPQQIIRRAEPNDIEALVALRKILLSTGRGHYTAKNPEEERAWQESYRDWLFRQLNTNPNINVAVIYNTLVPRITGCAIGIIDERVPFNGCLNGRMGWVQTVVVHPDYRRLGLAEQLMEFLIGWFQQNQVGKVALQTTPMAKSLYEKLDFVDSGEAYLIKTL